MLTRVAHLFSRPGGQEEQERLLELFWNRAELKKRLDKLRVEARDLNDHLQRQETTTFGVQQKLEQLEGLLSDSATAQTAVTYYQLRGVWQKCRRRISDCAAELSAAQKQREYEIVLNEFNRARSSEMAALKATLADVHVRARKISDETAELRRERKRRRGFWNFRRRRRITAALQERRAARKELSLQQRELSDQYHAIEERSLPELEDISVAGKRAINLSLVALAQEMYLIFAEQDIAALASEAMVRSVADVRYGNHRDCRAVCKEIAEHLAALEGDAELGKRIHQRARFLRSQLSYRKDEDTIPIAGSVAQIPTGFQDGSYRGQAPVNVLAEEYWDLVSLLLT